MKPPISQPNQTVQSQKLQRPVSIGDLFEMVGRQRTVWTVRKLTNIRNLPAQAEMNQVDGCGRVTVNIEDLSTEILFKRITEAVI
ncbi:hypothetical protein [Magnetospirillum gryphiswaldense]|jgi:hypothetical protein|uniref:Uncharacterized protein n=1 Tax=Magnetospirillum gryphiswaldense TaxID=55518 RepID=A4U0V6_9PROT|nr:hypothetical protein [Magnetospirillum gryphiswaldense]CAM76513.1 conserved hypothetical protein [Magnetospirillum gryphiswaldense MSR-1]